MQITKVSAETLTKKNPIVAPVTGPITSFAYTIRGQIKYRFLKPFTPLNGMYIIPAKNVQVNSMNSTTNEVKSVRTGKNGNYTLKVQEGIYSLSVSDIKNTVFLPQRSTVTVSTDLKNINFHGDIKYRLTLAGFKATLRSKAGQAKYNAIYDADNNGVINNQDFLLLKPILFKK